MKVATIFVPKCFDCPHYRNFPNDIDECSLMPGHYGKTSDFVPLKYDIPSWCPLPEYKNESNTKKDVDIQERIG